VVLVAGEGGAGPVATVGALDRASTTISSSHSGVGCQKCNQRSP